MPKVNRIVIGLTGGIATGKTTVLKAFARHRIPTISSDELAHACLRRGSPCHARIVRRFGRDILLNGQINRRLLGRIVFRDAVHRRWLEQQVHPCVIRGLRAFIRKHRGLMVLDIPLLYEAKLEGMVDAVVVVWSSGAQQVRRLKSRNNLDRVDALRRIRSQMPLAVKKKRADFLLDNTGNVFALNRQIENLLTSLRTHV